MLDRSGNRNCTGKINGPTTGQYQGGGKFKGLKDFTRQYVQTALWSSAGENGEPLDQSFSAEDIAPSTLKVMKTDSKKFLQKNHRDVGADMGHAGHDFWLTRNGHGTGFWDDEDRYGEDGAKRLSAAAKEFGAFDLYVGDDGKIHGGRF